MIPPLLTQAQQVTTAESSRTTVRPPGAGLLTWAKSVHIGAVDVGERVAQVIGQWVGGGQYLSSGPDLHGSVAACRAHELLDAPRGFVLDSVGYTQLREDDRQVGLE
jgi:hypothetical protein